MERNHREDHYVARVGWLRAAVLGANDGIVSTASLIVGVAAASGRAEVLLAGAAGLAAGALSMAAGEYVSVSSQSDTEAADIVRERAEIAADPEEELRALAGIYEDRGVPPELARPVAEALHARDPLAAHVRDELGIFEHTAAQPLVAAGASALTFAVGAALPLTAAALVGVSMTTILLVYAHSSVARVFFITAASFGALSLWGYTTKRDLSGMGTFLMMGLIGLLVAMIVNIFLASSALAFAISVIGVLIFAGLTAYDTQNIKNTYVQHAVNGDQEWLGKAAIMGALNLYLDFINLFMFLLQFFGNRE